MLRLHIDKTKRPITSSQRISLFAYLSIFCLNIAIHSLFNHTQSSQFLDSYSLSLRVGVLRTLVAVSKTTSLCSFRILDYRGRQLKDTLPSHALGYGLHLVCLCMEICTCTYLIEHPAWTRFKSASPQSSQFQCSWLVSNYLVPRVQPDH